MECTCGPCPVHDPICYITDCNSQPEWEIWVRVNGPFGILTSMVQKIDVCESHKSLSIKFENKKEQTDLSNYNPLS